MEKIKISTDSTADIPNALCESRNISVLPLTILHNHQEYRDGLDISPQDFYKILDQADPLPASAQVSTALYTDLFESVWQEGYTDLIHVTINSKGSGTYQAGLLSRELFFEAHPEAKDRFSIHILDSKTYSMAYGIPVAEAAQMVREGRSVKSIITYLEEWLEHARPVFIPLNLKCVKKSGRISPAAAFLGDAIGLKPLITFADGEAEILSKSRGEANAIAALVDRCVRERKPGTSYALVYGNNPEAYARLKEACAAVLDQPPLAEYPVGCVIAINTGPNMVGILYRT